jgi:hypothetical protein
MNRILIASLSFLIGASFTRVASAVGSAELYSGTSYGYGRVEARLRFAAGDGVVGSFFLWKDGSEVAGTFWNELDFEKVGADCRLETNAVFGNPAAYHAVRHSLDLDLCGEYHTYTYEWTPDAIVWLVDDVEIRRETGATATAFAENAAAGMQVRFNVWPGDATYGGNFTPAILPVHEYVDWVEFSTYDAGTFTLAWREDFDAGTLPSGWLTGNWASPKSLSTHTAQNVNVVDGYMVLSLTADDAPGPAGAMPRTAGEAGGSGMIAAGGMTAAGGMSASAGATAAAGASTGGAAGSAPGSVAAG